MTTIEHKELRGITIRNLVVTVISTASIVASVMTSYFQLKGDINEVKVTQEAQNRVNDIRLKIVESQLSLLQQQVDEIKISRNVDRQSKIYSTITNPSIH